MRKREGLRWLPTLLVGTSLAVLGAVVATASFRGDQATPAAGDDPVVQAWQAPETPFLWPENWARPEDRALLSDVQDAVEAGAPDMEWRLDPQEVVERFLATVLAWEAPLAEPSDPVVDGRAFMATPRCDEDAVDCDPQALLIVVDQPQRSGVGGIWSVVSVTSDALRVSTPPPAGSALPPVPYVDLEVALPDGRSAHAGFVASNACRQVSEFELDVQDRAVLTVPVAGTDDPSCGSIGAGYAFAYAMDDTTVPTGDPLLEAATIRSPWLTMVPILVPMGT